MKKINLSIKSVLVILCLTFIITNTSIKKSEATIIDVPLESGTLVGNIIDHISNIANQIKDYTQYVQAAASAYQTTQGVVQQVKSALLGQTAQNLTASQILNLGTTVLQLTAGDHGTSTNIFTKGNEVVTDLGNYLDQIGANEVKKALFDLQDPANLNVYSSNIKQAVTDFTKKTASINGGQIVTFALPYIARKEICNDPKLKDIITNGQPSNYILPKPAVANVDINQICQESGTIMSPQDQAIFVGLAKAGYGGQETTQALADPANSKTGVIASALSVIKNKVSQATDNAKSEVTATDLYTGQKQCFGKDGKPVDYEPNSKNLSNQFCYTTYTDPLQGGSAAKSNSAAAILAPYISMLANSNVAAKSQNCGANGDKLQTEQEGYGTDFQLQRGADIANTYSSCLALVGNAISGVIGTFGLGKKQANNALTDPDSPYARLYTNITSIASTQEAQSNLSNEATQQQKDYEYGSDDYTVDDLKNTISTYDSVRAFNIDRLNKELFTYAFVSLAIENGEASIPGVGHCSIFSCKKRNAQLGTQRNTVESLVGLGQAAISLNSSIRDLIREMAKDNYKNQQLNTLYNQFKNLPPDSLVASTSQAEQLKKALDGTLTLKDYTNLEATWQYVPTIMDTYANPLSANISMVGLSKSEAAQEKERESAVLIVPTDEQYGPYTDQNTLYLRARADKILLNVLNKESDLDGGELPSDTSADTKALLARYGINGIGDLNNGNLPLIGNKGVTNILDPDNTLTWGENDFCTHLGIMNTICKDLANPNTTNSQTLNDQLDALTDSQSVVTAACNDPTAYVAKVCTDTNNTADENCSTNQAELVTETINYCQNNPDSTTTEAN